MMDVLERSFETDVYHERDPRAFDNYAMRPLPVIRELYRASSSARFVIKALCELQELASLMAEFQPARTVWIVRRYPDVVNSMLVSFRNQAKQVRYIAEHGNHGGWWLGEGISETTYELLHRVVHSEIDDATAAALQWYFRNVLFFEQGLERDERVMLVPYERLVTRPQQEVARVFSFLGINYTPRVSANVSVSSIGKRNPPVVDKPVMEVCEALTSRFAALIGDWPGV